MNWPATLFLVIFVAAHFAICIGDSTSKHIINVQDRPPIPKWWTLTVNDVFNHLKVVTPCTKSIKMIKTEKYHHFHQAQRVRMFLKVVQTFKYIYYMINKYKSILFLLIPLSFFKPILKFLHTLFLNFIAHCIKEHVHCIWFLIYESSIAKSLKKS